jgi:hypothetical protein
MPGALENIKFSQAEFSRICGVSEMAISKQARNGTLVKGRDGKLTLGPTLRAYREVRRRDSKPGGSTESVAARLRSVTARAALEQRRLTKLEAEVLPAKRVEEEYNKLRELFRREMADLPARCAESVPNLTTPAEIAEAINSLVYERLDRIRNAE